MLKIYFEANNQRGYVQVYKNLIEQLDDLWNKGLKVTGVGYEEA